ncbi:hypothetical protein SUGI_0533400 [Cryptomeria japonica]|nr:hypothetical protein SUGI_0533400 [Cryptomeria japonica]
MGSLPPLTADAIALTEKKMDMTLVLRTYGPVQNKSQRPFPNKYGARDGASKAHIQQSMAARSSTLRQAKLTEMRSRNGNNQFLAVKEAARRIVVARSVQWNKRSSLLQLAGRCNLLYQRTGACWMVLGGSELKGWV